MAAGQTTTTTRRRGVFTPPPLGVPRRGSDPAAAEEKTRVIHVFRDATNARWKRVCLAALAALAAIFVLAHLFVRSLSPSGPNAALDGALLFDSAGLTTRAAGVRVAPPAFVPDAARAPAASPVPVAPRVNAVYGWVDPTEASALASLGAHAGALTDVAIEGLHVDGLGAIASDDAEAAIAKARARGVNVLLVVDALRDGEPRARDVTALGRSAPRSQRFAADLAARVERAHAHGVVLDFGEDEDDEGGAARAALVDAVRAAAPRRVLAISVRAGTSAAWLARAGVIADKVIVHAHLDAEDTPSPTPSASRAWVDATIAVASAAVSPEKLVVLLPTRASAWPVRALDLATRGAPKSFEWGEIVARARLAGARPIWQASSGNLVVTLPGSDGIASSALVSADDSPARDGAIIAWMVDGATFADHLAVASARSIGQIGLDALGGEDPRVWQVLAARGDPGALRRALESVPRTHEQILLGDGVEVRALDEERDGAAEVLVGRDGSVGGEAYRTLPADLTIVRRGRTPKKTIVLTFDDGPDPDFTPRVLDVLQRKGLKATFFMIGSRVEREPEIVKRIAALGHEIGNHSFSHSDLSRVPGRRADLEILSTNLLLEATTGRSTALFRPPYRADDHPDAEDVTSILAGQRNGVAIVTSTIDPRDWGGARSRDIVAQVLAEAQAANGGVVLLHDGGGDRSETVAALEPLIDGLRAKGFVFAQVRDIFGGTPMDRVNPPAGGAFDRQVAHAVWRTGTWGLRALQAAALLALVLGLIRVGSLIAFAVVDLVRHGRRGVAPIARPNAVSVIIPAYNESKVIERTVRSVLASRNIEVEVIVLDDGSKDGTGDVVAKAFLRDARVRLVRLVNGGKAAALNRGFKLAKHPIVVALDADTIFLPTTIAELADKFVDDGVGAVAGRAVVGNVGTLMARWQALEYVIGQAVERRAWHAVGLVSVVPGAVGAWRRDAVIDAGGFARDTLAEDCDLTIDLQVRGWRVEFAPDAIALTEAPEALTTLVKQRFRWSYGVLQAVWKHRRAAFRRSPNGRRVGLLLLPTVLVAHLATPLLAPAADVAAAIALYLGFGASVLPFAIASLVADAAITAFAMALDRASPKLAWDWLVFRALYRWILFASLVKAIVAAIKGGAVGWGKLVRTGTVHVPARAVMGATLLVALAGLGCAPLPPMTPDERAALGVPPPAPESVDDGSDDAKADAEPDVDAIVTRAEAAQKAGDLGLAEKLASEAIALDAKGYPYAYVVLGDVEAARGNHAAALAHFEKAVALDPNDAWSTTRLAETLAALHRESDARDTLRRFVATHPDADDEMLVALGDAERGLGDRARAETAYRNAATRAGGKNADALYGLAIVTRDKKEAARSIAELLQLDPQRREDLATDPSLAKARRNPAVRSLLARPRAAKPRASRMN